MAKKNTNTMLSVAGKNYRCECGANVFTIGGNKYECNGCKTMYTGEPEDKFNIGDTVKLPFNEEGVIVQIETKRLDWFPYKIRITKNTLNEMGEVLSYKVEQLIRCENEL